MLPRATRARECTRKRSEDDGMDPDDAANGVRDGKISRVPLFLRLACIDSPDKTMFKGGLDTGTDEDGNTHCHG